MLPIQQEIERKQDVVKEQIFPHNRNPWLSALFLAETGSAEKGAMYTGPARMH